MTRNALSIEDLEARALILRRRVVQMVAKLRVGYLQQGLGADDLFAALYFGELNLDESDPDWPRRDRFILSTAHKAKGRQWPEVRLAPDWKANRLENPEELRLAYVAVTRAQEVLDLTETDLEP